ncbi:hypothetical protein Tco_0025450 [Tanacetum coccineum]
MTSPCFKPLKWHFPTFHNAFWTSINSVQNYLQTTGTISQALDTYAMVDFGDNVDEFTVRRMRLERIANMNLLVCDVGQWVRVMGLFDGAEVELTIVRPSSMLSLMFNPQEFFLAEELLPLKKRGRDRSSSSTSALPQEFEIGESSRKTSLECHKEQIEEILNHLNELSLDRIELIEDKKEGLEKGQQMGNNSKIALARFRIANLEQIIKDIQARPQADKESLLNVIYEHKGNQEGPSDY